MDKGNFYQTKANLLVDKEKEVALSLFLCIYYTYFLLLIEDEIINIE